MSACRIHSRDFYFPSRPRPLALSSLPLLLATFRRSARRRERYHWSSRPWWPFSVPLWIRHWAQWVTSQDQPPVVARRTSSATSSGARNLHLHSWGSLWPSSDFYWRGLARWASCGRVSEFPASEGSRLKTEVVVASLQFLSRYHLSNDPFIPIILFILINKLIILH